jgi:hypothetical protein
MGRSFREFMSRQWVPCSIYEQEAAPAMTGAPPSPDNPDGKTNKHHFSFLKGQLGMEDEDFDAALESGSTTIWKVPDYSHKWGFVVAGSCEADIEKRPDGNYNVRFRLAEKKRMLPHSFFYPRRPGEDPVEYEGPVTDQVEVMTAEELQDKLAEPLKAGGALPVSMGGPMDRPGGLGSGLMGGSSGGAPPIPPAGGPPGGGT